MESSDLAIENRGQAAHRPSRERDPGESFGESRGLSGGEAAQESLAQESVDRACATRCPVKKRRRIGELAGPRHGQFDGSQLGRQPASEAAVAIAGSIESALVWLAASRAASSSSIVACTI